jgi:hypothetical protein
MYELTLLPGRLTHTQASDRLTSLLCLRKVHHVRLEELEEEHAVCCSSLPGR